MSDNKREIRHELTSHNSYKLFNSEGELIAEFFKAEHESKIDFQRRINNYKKQLANVSWESETKPTYE